MEPDQEQFYKYCCLDSAVTYEISEKIPKYLNVGQLAHYRRNVELLSPMLYMQLRGFRYNHAQAQLRLGEIQGHVYGYQQRLDHIARENKAILGLPFEEGNSSVLVAVRSHCCNKTKARDKYKTKKKKGVIVSRELVEKGQWVANDKFRDSYPKIAKRLEQEDPLSDNERGWVSVVCSKNPKAKTTMNTKSPLFKKFLYETLKLPKQYKKDPKTKEMRPTTDYLSLLKLSKKCPHPALIVALELSRLRTRAQMLAMRPYKGRMYCSYNLVGSETGRITSSKSMLIADEYDL